MDVVVNRAERCLVGVEISELRTNGLPVYVAIRFLLNAVEGHVKALPQRADVDAAAIEVLVILERHVNAADHGRTSDAAELARHP